MGRKAWEQFPEAWRASIISMFELQGVDFEKTFIKEDSQADGKPEEVSPWMTRKEAAGYAGVSTDTIDNWRKAGNVKYNKLADGRPGAVRIDRNSLRRFLSKRVVADPYKRVREIPKKGASYRVSRSN